MILFDEELKYYMAEFPGVLILVIVDDTLW